MLRCALLLFSWVVVISPALAVQPVTIRWHGQSFFEVITPKGTRIVLDPHAIENFGRITVKADIILMSHLHTDHTRVAVVEDEKKVKKINAIKEVKRLDRMVPEWNKVNEKFKDVTISTMGTYHDNMQGLKRGLNGCIILDVAGIRIVHLGDLGHRLSDAQLKQLGEVDVLMIPIGGVYTINGLVAADVVDQVKPKRAIVPMHYGVPVYEDLLGPDYFLDEMDEDSVRKVKGNEFVIDADTKAPKVPSVMMLDWK